VLPNPLLVHPPLLADGRQSSKNVTQKRSSQNRLSRLELGGAPTVESTNGLLPETSLPMDMRQGRPTVDKFLNSLDDSRDPGHLVCCPSCLLRDVRIATQARSQQRLRQCSKCRCAIALYEEYFEM
jgi:hypothetical protein